VWAVAWSPDGRLIATGSGDIDKGEARIVEAASAKEIARVTHDGALSAVSAVAWSPDGQRIATGSDDKTARIVEAASGKEIARATHDGRVSTVAWSPDGQRIATGSSDKTVRLRRVFPTDQALIKAAKARAVRCLTQAQRQRFFLPVSTSTWCVERRLWPYHGDEWQAWLPKRKAWLASGRQGEPPPMPKAE